MKSLLSFLFFFIIIGKDCKAQIQFQKTFGGTGDDVALCIWNTNDNGFALADYTRSFGAGGQDIYFVKTDAEGNLGKQNCHESDDILQQGLYSYAQHSPAMPETIPSDTSMSYSISAFDPHNETDSALCIFSGINESRSWSDLIFIYPNPSGGNFTISLTEAVRDLSIRISNFLGEEIYYEHASEFISKDKNIFLKPAPGIYFVRLNSGGKQQLKTLIIQ